MHDPAGVAGMMISAGQWITGGIISTTLKATVQPLAFDAVSKTVTKIGCDPAPDTMVPCTGFCVIVNDALAVQLSKDWALTSARTSGTTAWQLASAFAL